MTYTEDDLLALSALQHMLFCERQCALIHIEQIWTENVFTAEGRIMHERVHEVGRVSRGAVRVEYGMPLRSLRLGLIGKADVVEFHRLETGNWLPYPVEYKRGRSKAEDWDRVQLCAQAICLEEMLECIVQAGALFYGRVRRREEVLFDTELRGKTEQTAQRLHRLVETGKTPPPAYSSKCKRCSLFDECQPRALSRGRTVDTYIQKVIGEA